jgi:putative FmdB family regulatory protein
MPTYDYVCDGCGHKFEEFQSMKDDAMTVCPSCHQSTLRRLFGSGAAVIFKGSGFYQTDYRSSSYEKGAKADQEASKPASEKSADKPAADKPAGGTTDSGKSEGKSAKAGE